ncbi:TIGR03013 family XrtA/PEP-CTERM system glycosyltransferase [Motiliproteus sp. SC1-56]|uniref:TIGR03013 family XrtA/PEP-CTERM system glycosyltransferase n=1 Tax=Motiliproteus sp. SC1-56 TaxID=2799565 RepID=UPI001A8C92D8|nr:TIGR03013 family XrtA/PEP-CTERM system glycosyltransferase [Motiliproteus sp. SC1-56]
MSNLNIKNLDRGMPALGINKVPVRYRYMALALCETAAMLWCLYLGFSYSTTPHYVGFFDHVLCLECMTFVVVAFICMAAMGLYHARLRGAPREVVARVFLSFVMASIAQGVIFYFIPFLQVDPKAIALALIFSFFIVCLLRYGFFKLLGAEALKRRILVLGDGERASIIQDRMRRSADRQGFQVLGFVPMPDDSDRIRHEQLLFLNLNDLPEYVRANRVDEVVVAADQRRGNLPMEALYRCRIGGVKVMDIATFIERESGKIPLKTLRPSWLVYGEGYGGASLLVRMAKRGFDILISLLLLLLVWPLMVITALLIKLESGPGAPVLYTQKRVGLHGVPFSIFKFRSMTVDAEANGAVWARQNDQRVTAVGAFIRKYRIDELPQLFNILRGDMSFIGPRPERPEFVEKLSQSIPYYGDRHQVKPGLTGWAQICYAYGSSEADALEKLQYDLYYIKNFSFLLDTIILIQTAEVVFFGKGAR